LFAGTSKHPRGVFEVGWQVGNAGLHHRVNDAFRRQEWKSKRAVIPNRGVKTRMPRSKGRAAIVGGAELGWRVVPIENRAIGMPSQCRRIPDSEGAYDRLRRRGIRVGSERLEIGLPAESLEVKPDNFVGTEQRRT
jgi:hypothetical protein